MTVKLLSDRIRPTKRAIKLSSVECNFFCQTSRNFPKETFETSPVGAKESHGPETITKMTIEPTEISPRQ